MVAPRLTLSTALVLYAISRGHRYGFDIIDATRLGSGTVYPILRRLERAGLVAGAPEADHDPQAEGRPARRYYTVTGAGAAALHAMLERHPGVAAVFGGSADGGLRPV